MKERNIKLIYLKIESSLCKRDRFYRSSVLIESVALFIKHTRNSFPEFPNPHVQGIMLALLLQKQECNDESHNVQGHLKSELTSLIRYYLKKNQILWKHTLSVCCPHLFSGILVVILVNTIETKPFIYMCMFIKCGKYFNHEQSINPIDFEGHRSRSKFKKDGNNLVSMIKS